MFRQEACLSYYLLYAQSFFELAFSFSSVTSNIKHLQYYSFIPLSFTLYYPSHLVTLQHYCITLPYTVMLTFPILSHQSLVYTCSTPPIYSFCYKNSFFPLYLSLHVILQVFTSLSSTLRVLRPSNPCNLSYSHNWCFYK